MRTIIGVCVLAMAALWCCRCDAQTTTSPATAAAKEQGVKIEQIEFMGWKDCYKLSNGACQMVIVPAVGRVMSFSLTDGPEVIWADKKLSGTTVPKADGNWHNIGGDKLWPAEQAVWGWPPPWEFDGAPAKAEKIEGGVRITGLHSVAYGAHYVREFVMDPVKPLVTIRQHIVKTDDMVLATAAYDKTRDAPLTVWSITQVNKPLFSMLQMKYESAGMATDSATGQPEETCFRVFGQGVVAKNKSVGGLFLGLANDDEKSQKVGAYPNAKADNGWVAAVYDKTMIVESMVLAKDAKYPDENCPVEIYTAPAKDGSYVELELLGAFTAAKKDQKAVNNLIWQLVPVTAEQAKDFEKAAPVARQAHEAALKQLTTGE